MPNAYLCFCFLPWMALLGCIGNFVTGILMISRWRGLRSRFLTFIFLCFTDSAILLLSFKFFASEGLPTSPRRGTSPQPSAASLLTSTSSATVSLVACSLWRLSTVSSPCTPGLPGESVRRVRAADGSPLRRSANQLGPRRSATANDAFV